MSTPDPSTHGAFGELLAREDLSPEVRQKLQKVADDIDAQYQRMQGADAIEAGERAFARRPRVRLSAGTEPGTVIDTDEVVGMNTREPMSEQPKQAGGGSATVSRIRYTRSATGDPDQHERQMATLDEAFGSVSPEVVWRDDGSGMSLDRPGLAELLVYVRANPRVGGTRGQIEVTDYARLSRGEPHDLTNLAHEVAGLGWDFVIPG